MVHEVFESAVSKLVKLAKEHGELSGYCESKIREILHEFHDEVDADKVGIWHSVNNPPLHSGMYLVTINDNDSDASKKIVIRAFYNYTAWNFVDGKYGVGWTLMDEFYQFNDELLPKIVAWCSPPEPYDEESTPKEYDAEWITVADSKPRLGAKVLVSFLTPLGVEQTLGRYGNGMKCFGMENFEWMDLIDKSEIVIPLAWMPLPEKFNGEIDADKLIKTAIKRKRKLQAESERMIESSGKTD